LSDSQKEDEVLFSSKTKFQVKEITKTKDEFGYWTIDMLIEEL